MDNQVYSPDTQQTQNQKRSKAPVFIVLAVLLIAAAGCSAYLYGHKDVSKLNNQAAVLTNENASLNQKVSSLESAVNNSKTTTSTTTNAATINQNTVKIPTLGVQIVVPDDIKDLTVTPVQNPGTYNGQSVTSVTVSTATISSDIPQCKNTAFGTLTKYQGQYPSSGVNLTSWHEQFNGYYLALSPGEASCAPSSTSQTNQALLQAQGAVFDAALPSITATN